jgi:hypothetical protein
MEKSIKVMMYNGNNTQITNTVFPWFKIQNTGNTTIKLSEVKVRYYYTIDGECPQNFWCDWSDREAANVTGRFVKMGSPVKGADYYLEIGFKASAGSIGPGESVELHTRFAKQNWSNFDQSKHYSFNSSATSYVSWDKAAGFIGGCQVWGALQQKSDFKGRIKDAVDGKPVSGAEICIYNKTDNSKVASALTQADGTYVLNLAPGEYKAIVSKDKYISAVGYIKVDNADTTYNTELKLVFQPYTGKGTVHGFIRDSLNAHHITGAVIKFRSGFNVVVGDPVAVTITKGYGEYSAELVAGYYTGEIIIDGFVKEYFNLICAGGVTTDKNAVITPVMPEGQTAIVLTMDSGSLDLDSHLTGPNPEGGRFHVFHANKSVTHSGTAQVKLDVDLEGKCCETITICKQYNGVYRYAVHDFSSKAVSSAEGLSQSNAQVRVYKRGDMVALYNVPVNIEGTVWNVFEMEGDEITPVNKMSCEIDPEKVGAA